MPDFHLHTAPPLDFLRTLRIKNGVEILWNDHSLGCFK
jgi:hypothetical protein